MEKYKRLFDEAKSYSKEYYVDYDEDNENYGVFDNTGKMHNSYTTQIEAYKSLLKNFPNSQIMKGERDKAKRILKNG